MKREAGTVLSTAKERWFLVVSITKSLKILYERSIYLDELYNYQPGS